MQKSSAPKLTYPGFIALGFLAIILLGTFLLSLPVSSSSKEWTPFVNSLFTATTATCVTGLVVYDTFTHWSLFGQLVILTLIQIGGLGFMTFITLMLVFLKKRITLKERLVIRQSAGSISVSGVVLLVKKAALGTIIFEGIGAVLLALRFCPRMGFWRGVYNGIFHSVSAFCNAGIDIMGKYGQFSSLTTYASDPLVNFTIMALITVGGIGFVVWSDIIVSRGRLRHLKLHSKMALSATAVLLVLGTVLFMIFESDGVFKGMGFGQRLMASMFATVSPRTAGFNTVSVSGMSQSGLLLTVLLMLVGGSPGSTAGGIKTTTISVLFAATAATFKHMRDAVLFKRKIPGDTIRLSCSIVFIYLSAVIVSTLFIAAIEPISILEALFEVASAAGTVGLTMGITPALSAASRLVLILLMYFGRVGGISLALSFAEKHEHIPVDRPSENILVG